MRKGQVDVLEEMLGPVVGNVAWGVIHGLMKKFGVFAEGQKRGNKITGRILTPTQIFDIDVTIRPKPPELRGDPAPAKQIGPIKAFGR